MQQCEFGDQAALYALGLLDHAETAAFERHLVACALCTDELRESSEIAVALAQTIPAHTPPSALRERTLESAFSRTPGVRMQPSIAADSAIPPVTPSGQTENLTATAESKRKPNGTKPVNETASRNLPRGVLALARASEMKFQPTQFPGVSVASLFVDPVRGELASLVRVTPGARYPSHRHATVEHCYVLEGDLVFEDHTLGPGDYAAGMPDADHTSATTTQGCMLFIVHNLHDQIHAH
jgi:anti-sigma factor ChrR (cupin superfamily)